MSLLDVNGATDEVVVILREHREGARGRVEPVEVGRVRCVGRMQQSTTDDITAFAAAGEKQVLNLQRFYCRVFPGDDLSQVIGEDGVLYQVVGEPKRHHGSRRTRRDVVMLRQTGVRRGVRDGRSI